MEYGIVALAVLTLALLVALIVGRSRRGAPAGGRTSAANPRREPCLLCGSALQAGERVHSRRYSAGNEAIVHIHGCPHCHPERGRPTALGPIPRTCPVCKAALPPEGYVVGRMWSRKATPGARPRQHLHVLGCTTCRPHA